MPVRQRTRSTDRNSGRYYDSLLGGYVTPGPSLSTNDYIEDYPGPGDCQPLTVRHDSASGGQSTFTNSRYRMENWIPDLLRSNHLHANYGLDVPGVTSDSTAMIQTCARTNPSRPNVDLPVSIGELRELPSLLKRRGDNTLKDLLRGRDVSKGDYRRFVGKNAAEENLIYQFGISPIASDLSKLLEITTHVERRIEVIKRLASEKAYRKTVNIGTWSNYRVIKGLQISSSPDFFCDLTTVCAVGIRGHARWLPDLNYGPLLSDSQALRKLARKAVLGLTVDYVTAWNLMPWTWLIDWFSDFGDLMEAARNTIPAHLGEHFLAKETLTQHTAYPIAGRAGFAPWRGIRRIKSRYSPTLVPSAHFPFLNGRQVGILASLAVLRT